MQPINGSVKVGPISVETAAAVTLRGYIFCAPHTFWFSSNLFILFSGSIILTLKTGDNDDKIFGACCGGAGSVSVWSDGVAELLRRSWQLSSGTMMIFVWGFFD
jgi:hypothetical protein